MKTIGLIGGMSWESTLAYYRLINQGIRARLGGLHSAHILMESYDFATIADLQHAGRWDQTAAILAGSARRLEAAGADLLLICTNTMHKVADQVQDSVHIPLLHIADPTGDALRQSGISRVGLLGTAFTMEDGFMHERLAARFGLEVLVPEAEDRRTVHRIIYDELCQGLTRESSRAAYREVMARLVDRGAQGIVFGCTEIGLLVGPEDATVPVFDTTRLHCEGAIAAALAG